MWTVGPSGVAAAILVLVLGACTDDAPTEAAPDRSHDRVPTRLVEAELVDPSTLNVFGNSCGKQPTADVEDGDDVVTVTAYASPPDPRGEDTCGDVVTLRLEAPLGDRRVVDGSNGDNVTILNETVP